jgi:hypothetical protein
MKADLAFRLSRQPCAADRIGTKRSPDIDPDYHWNSCVPHLPHGHDAQSPARSRRAQRSTKIPTTVGSRHPSRQSFGTTRRVRRTGSHLGSTLNPGGAVLTRGVFRRSGSVACVRVAASPNEVLTRPMMHHPMRGGQTHAARVCEYLRFLQSGQTPFTCGRGRRPSSTSETTKSATWAAVTSSSVRRRRCANWPTSAARVYATILGGAETTSPRR